MSTIPCLEAQKLGRFKDKSAQILVVNSFAPERSMYMNALKELGFENVHGAADHKMGLGFLESESIDWLICPIQSEEKVNLYHVALLCQKYEHLKDVLITTPLSKEEERAIPCLAEMGVFSWFKHVSTLVDVKASLEKTLARIFQCHERLVDVTYGLLDEHLKEVREYGSLLGLYKNLMSLFPGDPQILLKLGEAYLLSGEKKLGSLCLQQLALIDKSLDADVQKLTAEYLGGKLPSIEVGSTNENPFGLKYALLVGLEYNTRDTAKALFERMAVPFKVVEDPKEAFEIIKSEGEPSLMLINWDLPVLPGPMFVQRLKEMQCFSSINLVVGKDFDRSDLALLYEMSISQILAPDIVEDALLESIIWSVQEDRRPLEVQSVFAKGRQALDEQDAESAISCQETLSQMRPHPEAEELLLSGEIFLAKNDANNALNAAVSGFKIGADAVLSLNLMGKAFSKLGEFEKAFQSFDQAQLLSPLNVQRLTAMAEVKFEMGDEDKSQELLDSAEDLDGGSSLPDASKAKIAIASGDGEGAKPLMKKLGSIKNVVSFLNNKAVALSADGSYEEATKLYQEALDAIPDEHKSYRSIVNFNLGLLFLRSGEPKQALISLGEVKEDEHQGM